MATRKQTILSGLRTDLNPLRRNNNDTCWRTGKRYATGRIGYVSVAEIRDAGIYKPLTSSQWISGPVFLNCDSLMQMSLSPVSKRIEQFKELGNLWHFLLITHAFSRNAESVLFSDTADTNERSPVTGNRICSKKSNWLGRYFFKFGKPVNVFGWQFP